MLGSRPMMIYGLVAFLAGGAILAFGGERLGVPVGTTVAIAGLGLLVWGWMTRSQGEESGSGK